MNRPGFVTGLVSEARLLAPLNAPVAVSGSNADAARQAAENLLCSGATALVSFGLAGGLDPALAPGALVVPEAVVDGDDILLCDAAMLAQLGGVTAARVASAAAVVESTESKAMLFRATGAVAVDLESGPIARVAAAHGIPFAVLRVIADPAGRALPAIVSRAVTPRGGIALAEILRHLAAHPLSVISFIRLGRDAAAAKRTLRHHVARLQCGESVVSAVPAAPRR